MAFITRTENASMGNEARQGGTAQQPIGGAREHKAKRGVGQRCALAGCLILGSLMLAACSSTSKSTSAFPRSSTSASPTGSPGSPSTSIGTPSSSASTPPVTSSPSPSSPTEVGYYLADFNTVQTYGINVDSTPRKVNGIMYNHPVAWAASPGAGDPYWAEWDLSRSCTWLTSPGVGISDEAPSGSQYTFYIQTDGSYKWQKTISLGQSDSIKVSIKGALRLRLSAAGLQNGGYGPLATWGDAQVWCSSEPPNRKS
jgi:NPCBM/NEW2 domain